MAPLAISVENLTKEYRVGVLNRGALYKDLQSHWARWRGLPDPNASLIPPEQKSKRLQGDKFRALDNISIEVEQGETLGIIGRNGAGKSTFLKVLSRITLPSAGTVRMRGRLATLLEVGTGFHPELTGRENVFLNGTILGMAHAEVWRKFDEIVAFAEIDQFIDTPVKRYSSGMYVRLAFAVAAHLDPEILIVDEVLAVGDLNFQKKCFARMSDARREGKTVLFVSHNLAAIGRLCSKSVLFEDGKVVDHGKTSQIVARYIRREVAEGPADVTFEGALEFDAVGKIRRISVESDSADEPGVVQLTQPFSVSIEYELARPVKGVTISIEVQSEELGAAVISLSDSELQNELMEGREAGLYRARVRIPDRILNTGSYHIRSGMVQSRSVIDVAEGAAFRVEDSDGIVAALGYDRKNSVTSIQLPWHIEKMSR